MNIKSGKGKVVHLQKQGYRTACGRSLTVRLFNRQDGLFHSEPYYTETDEKATCKKCLELLEYRKVDSNV